MKTKNFCLKDSQEKEHCLKDYQDKWVVLYFYPKDGTPGCTLEAVQFSELKNEFKELNAVILGVSKDSCDSHQKFVDKHSLTITLLSDPTVKVMKEYGVWQLKKFMGREYMGAVRSTFLINPQGLIVHEWLKVKAKGHAREVLSQLKSEQTLGE